MHSKRQLLGLTLIFAGACMIGCCIVLIRQNLLENDRAAADAASHLAALRDQLPEQPETIQLPELYKKANQVPVNESAFMTDDCEMQVMTLDGTDYIGILTIPALGLELPVYAEWDYSRLRSGPCRYYGSTASEDLVIAGHNYDSVFGRLRTLNHGDEIVLTDAEGQLTCYTVGEIEILPPDAVTQMTESPWPLTLYTCTFSGTERVTVRCGYWKESPADEN